MAGLIRVFPHRTASAEDAIWAWWMDKGDGKVECPSLVVGWDYSMSLRFGVEVSVALDRVLESTGLRSVDDLSIVAVVDCKGTASRFVGTGRLAVVGDEARAVAEVEIPAGSVAQAVQLSSCVVRSSTSHGLAPRVASSKGARLLNADSMTVLLEGDSGRFPTEPVAFSREGLGNAPWTLMLSYENLTDSFMGSVRLLINTEHPVGKAVLDPEQAPRFTGLMRADLLRGLVARLWQDGAGRDECDLEEDSVAGVVSDLCQSMLGYSLAEAGALFSRDPIEFELRLQRGLDPYRKLVD